MNQEKVLIDQHGKKVKSLVWFLAVFVNLVLCLWKIFVWFLTWSAVIIADWINSATDVVASSIGFFWVKIAQKPADENHPYWHEKAEVLAWFIITLIIFWSWILILYEAIKSFFVESNLSLWFLAFFVMVFSAIVNYIMSWLKIYIGKKYNSVSLVSDWVHSKIDFRVSLSVFLWLFLINYFPFADSILAIGIWIYIFKQSFELWKETTDSLIWVSASKEIENQIKDIILKKNIHFKNLKTQKLGNNVFAEIALNFPSKLKAEQISNITLELKNELIDNIETLKYIVINVESYETIYWLKNSFNLFWKNNIKKEWEWPWGYCVCSNDKCSYKEEHQRWVACSSLKCPKCWSFLKRWL